MTSLGYLNRIPLKWPFALIILFISIRSSAQSCNTWLNVPSQPSYVRVGDLDVTGDKITVEAIFNRTAPWNGLDVFQGDLVSKHEDPSDCNYLLRPSSAEITTTNGYFKTPTICPIQLNKTYHAAFVYDGIALKFYRNGFLMSQIAASGNLIQNDWQTQIGLYFNQLTQENFIGYINEVRIWKIARTQDQIKQYMAQSLPAPATQNGLLAYYVFDNLLNKQGNSMWNGTLGGTATINKTNPNCTFVADSCSIIPCSIQPPDFSFEQDVCNPKKVAFQTNATNIKSYQWNVGNGQLINSSSVSIAYADYGTYPVTLTVEDNNGCKANLTKSILIGLEQGDIIQTNDTSICEGVSIHIQPKDTGVGYCWQPASGTSSFWVKPSKDTILTLTAKTIGANLVANGNFSGGNIGFSSAYTFSSSGIPQGVYSVGNNPTAWHAGMVACGDKTTGVGNMLLVNGAQQPNVVVWTQTITVTPHTNYAFSTWVQTITTINPAKLQFSINGKLIGNVFTADAQSCLWKQFSASWNSGAATTATIAIVNMNQDFSGNDFALDDIFFGTVKIKQETLNIKVAKSPAIDLGPDKEVCAGSSVQLHSNLEQGTSIQWTPTLYLDNAQAENPVSSPLQSVTYVAEAVNAAGCSRKDTLHLTRIEMPSVTVRSDTAACQGTPVVLNTISRNANVFSWHPQTGLSDPTLPNPVATPANTTQYIVTSSNRGCEAKDTVLLTINALPTVTITPDTTICANTSIHLRVSGGTTYQWSPQVGLSSTTTATPIASPISSTTYHVDVKGANGCYKKDSVTIALFPKPQFQVMPTNSTLCKGEAVTLRASGGDSYSWHSGDGNLIASADAVTVQPESTSTYKLVVSESICSNIDSFFTTVTVNPLPTVAVQKVNDIDCSNFETQLIANSSGESFEWSPANGLSNVAIPNPIARPTESTTYVVTVKTIDGCTAKDSIRVNVTNNGKSEYYIPSAFTPNRDGKNDCFSIKSWPGVKDFSIQIYNRWGERVFVSTTLPFCWNGTFNGIAQPPGVFVYQVRAKTACGDIYKKGTITLIR